MSIPRPTLFDQALREVLNAHGINRVGLCKAKGEHREAVNDEDPEAQMDEAGDLTLADLQRIDEQFGITKPRHAMTRERSGFGPGDKVWVRCSCGWTSEKFSESDDFMSTKLRNAEQQHWEQPHG